MKQDDTALHLPVFYSPPGAVAVDLDGTLLNSRSELSARNRQAIETCLSTGIPVIIATSRPARAARRFLGDDLADSCSLVLQNGAIAIAAPPLAGRYCETLSSSLAVDIIETILRMEPETRVTIEIEGYRFGTNRPRTPDELWRFNSATPDMQVSLEAALSESPTKIAAGGLDRDITHIAAALSERFNSSVSVVPADGLTFLNITAANATKPGAIRRLLASRGTLLENVVAFGDDIPDIDMLAACGTAIAMGNSFPDVKAVCDYFTLSNDEDGVAVALEYLLEGIAPGGKSDL